MRQKRFMSYEWMVALGYLRAKREESMISLIAILSFLGITLGVAALIVVMAVMNGFREELLGRILGVNGHIIVQNAPGYPISDLADLANDILTIDGVRQAAPVLERQALLSGPNQAAGVYIRGITKKNLLRITQVKTHIISGTLDNFEQGMVIGRRLARSIGVQVGDYVLLLSPKGVSTPFGTLPRTKRVKIIALFEIGMSEIDNSLTFLPLNEIQDFLSAPGEISNIEVMIDYPDDTAQIIEQIKAKNGNGLFIQDWRQTNSALASALQVERNVMFVILTMIIMIAALNIVSGLVFLVKDKTGEIAMLRVMGASRAAVTRIFFIVGSMIGVMGSFSGFILGWLVCANIEEIRQFFSTLFGVALFTPEIYFLSQLPAKMDMAETAVAVLVALLLSFGATLYPSWRASAIYPTKALRYE